MPQCESVAKDILNLALDFICKTAVVGTTTSPSSCTQLLGSRMWYNLDHLKAIVGGKLPNLDKAIPNKKAGMDQIIRVAVQEYKKEGGQKAPTPPASAPPPVSPPPPPASPPPAPAPKAPAAGETAVASTSNVLPLGHVTDTTFDREVLQSDIPVVVKFTADWCDPCHLLQPTIESLAKKYQGRVKFLLYENTLQNSEVVVRYNVYSLPTVMIFKNGKMQGELETLSPRREQIMDAAIRKTL